MTVGIGIIGTGKIVLANHLPGLSLTPRARLVALCDTNPATLAAAARQTGCTSIYSDYLQLLDDPAVDAVIIATPNFFHPPIVFAAIERKKHILCEKPLALDYPTARAMADAATDAGIVNMTAFTYRFVPAMRYLHHLVQRGDFGQILHFRAQRFQDWAHRAIGWRQIKQLAGTGEIGDMLSHRIDYAHLLVGSIARLVADTRIFLPDRSGQPADVEDWVGMICRFHNGASGVLESSKLCTGRGENHRGLDLVEINGTDASATYSTQRPLQLQVGRRGDSDLSVLDVPRQFLVHPGSPRDPGAGDPLATFRYDQDVEFIDAILHQRPATPSFEDGAKVQQVMDAIVQSAGEGRWIDLPLG